MSSATSHFSLNKRDRIDKDEVRQRMLDVAASYITDTGLTVSLEHISYEAVIQSADVPRSAVYRLWPRKEDFFEDLLRELASQKWHGTAVLDERYFHEALLAALEYEDQFDTEEGRRRALLNAARAGIERDFEHLASSASWRTYVALAATVLSLPEGQLKNDLQFELQESEALITDRFANYYMTLSRQVGFKLRDEFGTDYSILATAGASIVEGFALRGVISPQVAAGNRRYILDRFGLGRKIDWSLAGFACIALFDQMIVPDPSYDHSQASKLGDLARQFLATQNAPQS